MLTNLATGLENGPQPGWQGTGMQWIQGSQCTGGMHPVEAATTPGGRARGLAQILMPALIVVPAVVAGLLHPAGSQAAEPAKPAPTQSAPTQSAPAQPTPASSEPARPATAQSTPKEPAPAPQEDAFGDDPPPPPDLVVLVKKATIKGLWRLGVFGRVQDPSQPLVWRLKLWEQTEDRVIVSTDVLNCSPSQPMRITGASGVGKGVVILRELNPGGPITPANRLDHQIWWAACFPEQAGKDPATLGPEARRLGFNGTLVEREQVVPGARRP